MTALIAPSELPLRIGVNVIVRAGDYEVYTDPFGVRRNDYRPPAEWMTLTGPCPTCKGIGQHPYPGKHFTCPDCRDGRRIVPLWAECPNCAGIGGYHGRVLVGRGSIEVVPVVDKTPEPFMPHAFIGGDEVLRVWPAHGQAWFGEFKTWTAPGRDWAIILDVVDLAGEPSSVTHGDSTEGGK